MVSGGIAALIVTSAVGKVSGQLQASPALLTYLLTYSMEPSPS